MQILRGIVDIFCMRPIVLANSFLSWIKNRKKIIDFSAMLLLVLEGEKKSGKLRSLWLILSSLPRSPFTKRLSLMNLFHKNLRKMIITDRPAKLMQAPQTSNILFVFWNSFCNWKGFGSCKSNSIHKNILLWLKSFLIKTLSYGAHDLQQRDSVPK